MMESKLPRVIPTCHESRFGSWFELDWAGRPNHSMTARHVVLAERKLMTYVYAVEAHLQVPLASRYIAVDAGLWWMSLGEPVIPEGLWADFRTLIIARYGPLPDKEANMPYRDPDIYNDMYMRRYLNYAAEWQAYPNESMRHYCRRDGLPLGVKQFVPAPIMRISLEDMIDAIMEAEIISYMGGSVLLEDPIPAVPLQEIPPQETEANADNNEVNPSDFLATPEDQLEDPLIIIIANDDDEEDIEEEVEEEWEEFEGMKEEIEDVEDDLEEILFSDDDWDVFFYVTTE
ncbi:hypothetical protein TIFTF001_027786 [Ficus carica]|uniref:Uncharacterized protein n=1 Tax=Ficus carica TaxID=3494 RepID=A0AA88DP35_FICCA|nr:hypothetical protein TIFTF001_027786 [Ficus carica]